jgi:polyhydroxyalkanoate synthesis regulator phasin
MVMDSLRGYVQLATGLTEVTVSRAREVARQLLAQGLDMDQAGNEAKQAARQFQDQVAGLADDLMEQGRANREALVETVNAEVEKVVGRLGFVREEELAALRAHVMRLEAQVARTGSAATPTKAKAAKKTASASKARKSSPSASAKRTTAKKATKKTS